MIKLNGHFNGKNIVLDEKFTLAPNQKLTIIVHDNINKKIDKAQATQRLFNIDAPIDDWKIIEKEIIEGMLNE